MPGDMPINTHIGDCNLVHSQGGPNGENLAKSSGGAFRGTDAMNLWVARIKPLNGEALDGMKPLMH